MQKNCAAAPIAKESAKTIQFPYKPSPNGHEGYVLASLASFSEHPRLSGSNGGPTITHQARSSLQPDTRGETRRGSMSAATQDNATRAKDGAKLF